MAGPPGRECVAIRRELGLHEGTRRLLDHSVRLAQGGSEAECSSAVCRPSGRLRYSLLPCAGQGAASLSNRADARVAWLCSEPVEAIIRLSIPPPMAEFMEDAFDVAIFRPPGVLTQPAPPKPVGPGPLRVCAYVYGRTSAVIRDLRSGDYRRHDPTGIAVPESLAGIHFERHDGCHVRSGVDERREVRSVHRMPTGRRNWTTSANPQAANGEAAVGQSIMPTVLINRKTKVRATRRRNRIRFAKRSTRSRRTPATVMDKRFWLSGFTSGETQTSLAGAAKGIATPTACGVLHGDADFSAVLLERDFNRQFTPE